MSELKPEIDLSRYDGYLKAWAAEIVQLYGWGIGPAEIAARLRPRVIAALKDRWWSPNCEPSQIIYVLIRVGARSPHPCYIRARAEALEKQQRRDAEKQARIEKQEAERRAKREALTAKQEAERESYAAATGGSPYPEKRERMLYAAALRDQGFTMIEIGDRLGIGRGRVWQILREYQRIVDAVHHKGVREERFKALSDQWMAEWASLTRQARSEREHADREALRLANKGRPIDMGGPRDVWIERDPWSEL